MLGFLTANHTGPPVKNRRLVSSSTSNTSAPLSQSQKNTTLIYPDNMISVHAWNRLKRGIISSSSKVTAFLYTLSENNIDIIHCPGVNKKVADYGSRNPPTCSEKRLSVPTSLNNVQLVEHCKVNSVSVHDILSDKFPPPLTEKSTWLQIQRNDDTHSEHFSLITFCGLQPEKKLKRSHCLKTFV